MNIVIMGAIVTAFIMPARTLSGHKTFFPFPFFTRWITGLIIIAV